MAVMTTSGEQIVYMRIFLYLQVLDVLTTLVGLKLGAAEANPFIRWMMHWHPGGAIVASKLVALGLAGLCIWSGRHRVLRRISYWYASLVVWNLGVILVVR